MVPCPLFLADQKCSTLHTLISGHGLPSEGSSLSSRPKLAMWGSSLAGGAVCIRLSPRVDPLPDMQSVVMQLRVSRSIVGPLWLR